MTDLLHLILEWVEDMALVVRESDAENLAARIRARQAQGNQKLAVEESCENCKRFVVGGGCPVYNRCKGIGSLGEFRWSDTKRDEWERWLKRNTGSTVRDVGTCYVRSQYGGSIAGCSVG